MRQDPVNCPPYVTQRIQEMLEVEIERQGSRPVQEMLKVSGGEFTALRRAKTINFGIADKVVFSLWGAHVWHCEPELSQWYETLTAPILPGVRLEFPGRRHQTPCKACGCKPDERTLGCKSCNNRMYRRRVMNKRGAWS